MARQSVYFIVNGKTWRFPHRRFIAFCADTEFCGKCMSPENYGLPIEIMGEFHDGTAIEKFRAARERVEAIMAANRANARRKKPGAGKVAQDVPARKERSARRERRPWDFRG